MWTVPEEIKDAVATLEQQEREHAALDEADRVVEEAEKAVARQREVERIKGEMKGTVKRKAPETVPVDELVVTKKAKVEEDAEEGDDDDSSEESEEEEWQREAAAQLAAEAEEERRIREEEAKRAKEAEEAEAAAKAKEAKGTKGIVMPEHVEMSIEEGKALFKVGRHVHVGSRVSNTATATDSTTGEGHQSTPSLGHCSSALHLRSPLCSSTVSFCTT